MSKDTKQGRPFIDLKQKANEISLEDEFYTIRRIVKVAKGGTQNNQKGNKKRGNQSNEIGQTMENQEKWY